MFNSFAIIPLIVTNSLTQVQRLLMHYLDSSRLNYFVTLAGMIRYTALQNLAKWQITNCHRHKTYTAEDAGNG